MPDDAVRLNWTEEQWASVHCRVQEMAGKARVASSCLPVFGPLPPGQASVPTMETTYVAPIPGWFGGLRPDINDGITFELSTLAANVYLTTQQVQDPDLTSAKQLLGRAASVIGRLEDAIVFLGQPAPGVAPAVPFPAIFEVHGGQANPGLLDAGFPFAAPVVASGPTLVRAVGDAIQQIENQGHFGPFACFLGNQFFQFAVTPAAMYVTARDNILPLLEGGCLRRCSSIIPGNQGVVVALAGSPVDLVVATDVHVTFLQISLEPRYVLRVSERLVLRVKEVGAVCRLV